MCGNLDADDREGLPSWFSALGVFECRQQKEERILVSRSHRSGGSCTASGDHHLCFVLFCGGVKSLFEHARTSTSCCGTHFAPLFVFDVTSFFVPLLLLFVCFCFCSFRGRTAGVSRDVEVATELDGVKVAVV